MNGATLFPLAETNVPQVSVTLTPAMFLVLDEIKANRVQRVRQSFQAERIASLPYDQTRKLSTAVYAGEITAAEVVQALNSLATDHLPYGVTIQGLAEVYMQFRTKLSLDEAQLTHSPLAEAISRLSC